MIRELEEKDFIKVNELLKDFNYELNKESFDNDFLNMLDLFIFRYKAIFTTKQINVNIKLEEINS